MRLRIRNWERFQHYKDRNPPWIKLHRDLLTSKEWVCAPNDSIRSTLIALMLLAARDDNSIAYDPEYIQRVAHLPQLPDLEWFLKSGFLEKIEGEGEDKWTNPWPSRYVSDELREEVLRRDGNRCIFCSATENLELDHIIPVSKGGSSLVENLQTLCRSCNRTKRTRISNATRSVAFATRDENLRSLETEERQRREEKETEDKMSKYDDFILTCERYGWKADLTDGPNGTRKKLSLKVKALGAGGQKIVKTLFEEFAATHSGESIDRPIAMFLGEYVVTSLVNSELSTDTGLDSLARELYRKGGSAFSGKSLAGLRALRASFTDREIAQAWDRFLTDEQNTRPEFLPFKFVAGAGKTIIETIREDNERRERQNTDITSYLEESKVRRAEERAIREAQEAADERSWQELMKELEQ